MRMRITCSSTCSWCVVSALATLSCGSRRIIQVDAAHWWWLRRDSPPPPHMIVKHFGCTAIHNKALYKCIIHSFIFRMQRYDSSSTSPKEPMLHLSLSPCTGYLLQPRIKLKTLMIAYRTTTISAPAYFHSLLQIYIPSRSLRSASERRLVVPSQRDSKSLSRTFSFTVPGRWNDLRTRIRNAGSLSIFKQQLKTHLVRHYLTSS